MKDIFANLYNKVVSFFHQTDEEKSNAKDVACNRLKLVLMQDRTNLTPAIMDRMKRELIELLSKYVELDKDLLDLNLEHEDNQMALMLSIPVIRAKNEDEIQEMIDKEEEEKKRQESADDDSDDEQEDFSEKEDELEEDNDDEDTDSDDEEVVEVEVEEIEKEVVDDESETELEIKEEKKLSKKNKK